MAPLRHGFAQVGDVRLHYVARGSGGRLVVLLHGFPECWYSWRHQLRALGERYTVIAPDLRGYNLSDKPPRVEDYRIDRLLGDIAGLVRHLGREDAAIVGHDWGAVLAWAFARSRPERVWKLAALQVPPLAAWWANRTPAQALRSAYVAFFQLPLVPEWALKARDFALLRRVFRTTVVRRGAFTPGDMAVYKEAWRQPGALTGGLNYYRALRVRGGFARARQGGRIRVPTLFLYGEQDFAILPQTVRGVGSFVDAPYQEVRIPGCGHWVQNEAAAEVNSALSRFLETA